MAASRVAFSRQSHSGLTTPPCRPTSMHEPPHFREGDLAGPWDQTRHAHSPFVDQSWSADRRALVASASPRAGAPGGVPCAGTQRILFDSQHCFALPSQRTLSRLERRHRDSVLAQERAPLTGVSARSLKARAFVNVAEQRRVPGTFAGWRNRCTPLLCSTAHHRYPRSDRSARLARRIESTRWRPRAAKQ